MFDRDHVIEQLTKIIDDATNALDDLCESGGNSNESCNLWVRACAIERRAREIKQLSSVDRYTLNDVDRSERSLKRELNM